MSLNVGTLSGTLELDTKPHDDALDRSTSRYSQVASAGTKAMAIVGASLSAVGTKALGMSFEFNAAMANVGSLIPGNTKRVVELKKAVQDMAIDLGQRTGDLAAGLYQTESAFGDNADTVKILGINAKAAKAGVASVSDAIALTSAVTKGYGDTTATAVQHAADLAALTVRMGQTTFPELAASIGAVAPLTASLKVSQEELFAVMATGTGVTGGAAEVSTQLRGIMQSLMAPTAGVTKLMKEQGVADGQALIKKVGLKGAVDLMVQAASRSHQPLQAYISSIEGQTLALALAGGQSDTYAQKLTEMGRSGGATDAAFKAQTEGINKAGFMWDQLRSRAEVTMQRIGDKVGEIALDVGAKANEMRVALMAGLSGQGTGADGLAGVAERIGSALRPVVAFVKDNMQPVLAGVGAVVLGVVVPALWAWAAAQAAVLAPVLAIGLAIGVLVGGVVYAYQHFAVFRDVLATVADFVTGTVVPGLAQLAATVIEQLGRAVDWVQTYWPQISEAIGHTMRAVREVIGVVVDWVSAAWRAWGDDLLSMAKRVFGFIKETVENDVKFVQAIIQTVLALINGDWGRAWDGVKQALAAVWDQIKNIVSTAMSLVKSLLGAGMSSLQEVWRGAWDVIARVLNAAWDGIYKAVTENGGKVVSWFADLPGKAIGAVGRIGNQMFELGIRIIEGLMNGIGSMAGALKDKVVGIVTSPIGLAKKVLGIASPSRVFFQIGQYMIEGHAAPLQRRPLPPVLRFGTVTPAALRLATLAAS